LVLAFPLSFPQTLDATFLYLDSPLGGPGKALEKGVMRISENAASVDTFYRPRRRHEPFCGQQFLSLLFFPTMASKAPPLFRQHPDSSKSWPAGAGQEGMMEKIRNLTHGDNRKKGRPSFLYYEMPILPLLMKIASWWWLGGGSG